MRKRHRIQKKNEQKLEQPPPKKEHKIANKHIRKGAELH